MYCFLGDPPPGSRDSEINSVLSEKEDIPFLIIVTVSAVGVVLLLLNIVLVSCYVRRRITVAEKSAPNGRKSILGSSANLSFSGWVIIQDIIDLTGS